METKKIMSEEETISKLDKLNKIAEISESEEFIVDNKIIFTYENVQYRLHLPSYGEKKSACDFRNKLQIQMLKARDENGQLVYSTEVGLRKLYKEQGIDIEDIEKAIKTAQNDLKTALLRLGSALEDEAQKLAIESYKKDAIKMKEDIEKLSIKKSGLLECSIENQVITETFYFLAAILTEKKDGENWVKAWKDYEEYKKEEEGIVNKTAYYVSLLTNITLGM